jgi:uncharacterized repeat protein (TIGR03803 family)
MTRFAVWKKASVIFLFCAMTAIATAAQTFKTLGRFNIDNGEHPLAALAQGTNGALYGTTSLGGANAQGTVFEVSPAGIRNLYSFCSQTNCTDGDEPLTGLLLAIDGDFYGTAADGGAFGGGALFKINATGALQTIYSFCSQSCPDGAAPRGTLIQARDLNFYGTTSEGGAHVRGGTVFRLSRTGVLTTLHSFCAKNDCHDGETPYGTLMQGSDGNLYGTTNGGGAYGDGTIFQIAQTGQFSRLYSFCSPSNCTEGYSPLAGLIEGSDGNLYGITSGGGINDGGTAFKITPQGTLTTLYSFCSQPNCSDGGGPSALVQATDGNFYGTTFGGGTQNCVNGCGTIFSLTTQGRLTTLHTFCAQPGCSDGSNPDAGLLQGTNGLFYGTTVQGGGPACGQVGCGTVFSLSVGLGPFVAFVHGAGKVGQNSGVLGQGFTGTTGVSFNGVPATYTLISDTYLTATVPAGATTGFVTVVTPSGTLTSNVPFRVLP